MTEFILFALLAGIGVVAVAGPWLFCCWRRMAYFGDTPGTARYWVWRLNSFEHRDWLHCCASVPIDCPIIGGSRTARILAIDTLLGILFTLPYAARPCS